MVGFRYCTLTNDVETRRMAYVRNPLLMREFENINDKITGKLGSLLGNTNVEKQFWMWRQQRKHARQLLHKHEEKLMEQEVKAFMGKQE